MASTYFTSLRIEGLRGFGDAQVLELAVPTGAMGSGLTIVVGANNSGKSSIVEAFDAVYRATRHQSVSFSADRRHAGAKQRVSIALYREDGRSVGVESLRAGTSEARATWDGTATGETFRIDVTAVPARRQFSAYFGRYGDGDRGWASMSAEYSRSENRDEFVGRLFALHADENRLRTFNTLLAEVTGRALSWEIDLGQQQQYFLRFSEHEGGSHTSDGLGDGLISLLFILDALHDSSPESLIVIDEPELSLHPQYVARLGAVLTRFAADRQIVFATHAPALVDWQNISRGARICRVYKTHGRSFIAQPSTSTTQEIASGHLSNTNNPHVFGPAGNEVFFQEDGLLVLEGQEDVIFLPAVASSLGASLIGNTFGWGAGGAARIRSILTLFRELHFSRVAVLLDGDPQTRKTAEALQREFPEYKIATHPAHDIRTKPAQRERPERIGLLDSDGSTVRPAYREGARAALTEIGEYLSSRESSSLDPDSV